MAEPATTKKPWNQQKGENDLWFSRFLRFVALGPGRSVSLVSKGRRNAYPIPAHWPIQAKQRQWRERAQALDEALASGALAVSEFNNLMMQVAPKLKNEKERKLLGEAIEKGGYVVPPPDEDEYTAATQVLAVSS